MNFIGTGQRLTPDDLRAAAAILDCDVAAIRALLSVESSGRGFDFRLRPTMLFEPHVFYGRLNGVFRDRAIVEGLAYPRWGERPYPKSADARYDQIERAIAIDLDTALESASWGLGQIMGFNYRRAGYENAAALVEAAKRSEGDQFFAMCRFIKSAHLDDELREHRWAEFARGYNGPGYAKNRYDTKLADAYTNYFNEGRNDVRA